MLAPGSPLKREHLTHQANGINAGLPRFQLLDVPRPDILTRPRSASPSLGGGELEEGHIKSTKKHKLKSHFGGMFRLHKHKKAKKSRTESDEAALLSHSDGASLLRQKLQQQTQIRPSRQSFSGQSRRSISPGSTHSFPGFMESEGESEDEFLKTLMNPTGRAPSPLLVRTPDPVLHNGNSVESESGRWRLGSMDHGRGGENYRGQGDDVSIATSNLEASNLVSAQCCLFAKAIYNHIRGTCPRHLDYVRYICQPSVLSDCECMCIYYWKPP